MQTEKLQIIPNETGKTEVIIREVSSVNELQVKAPLKLKISGTIGAVSEFLNKRFDQLEQVNQKRCHIIVDREKITIELVTNENDDYNTGTVKGKLEFYPKFVEFGINSGKVWTPQQLGLFFKMNRSFFEDRSENMRLIALLMNFTATVNNSIERSVKENGDKTDNFSQIVNSNLPASFQLKMAIFKGTPAESIEVETFAQINGREVSFTLISPGAQAALEEIRDKAVDEQLEAIRSICPDIAIIEQ